LTAPRPALDVSVDGEPSRFPALRLAGEGTGGALVLSALTSMGGFLVMALAPMPVLADFGLLTAVMILFSLVVALFVLPSLLLLVTPSRKGRNERHCSTRCAPSSTTHTVARRRSRPPVTDARSLGCRSVTDRESRVT
jgi:multidrug efflux pump subunit AcrB